VSGSRMTAMHFRNASSSTTIFIIVSTFHDMALVAVAPSRGHQGYLDDLWFACHLHFPHDPASVIHDADARLLDQDGDSRKWSTLRFSDALGHKRGPRFCLISQDKNVSLGSLMSPFHVSWVEGWNSLSTGNGAEISR
jgi:hypothetical protein